MKNPWGNIPTTAPFVLADDAPYVEAFDAICDRTDGNDHKLDTNFPPSPFAGLQNELLAVLFACGCRKCHPIRSTWDLEVRDCYRFHPKVTLVDQNLIITKNFERTH